MKRRSLLFIFLWLTLSVQATEWYHFSFDFPYFKYFAEQLLGTSAYVPDMFPMSVKLNDYVKDKVRAGQLKDKPVVYNICPLDPYQEGSLLEIYETPESYHIHIYCRENFKMYLECEELKKIIDYFTHPEFTPYSGGAGPHQKDQIREELFRRIDPLVSKSVLPEKKEYEVYRIGEMSVCYDGKTFRLFSGKEELGLLTGLVSQPIQYKDRILFADQRFFYVYEAGCIIKKIGVRDMLENGEFIFNRLLYRMYPDWINFYEYISNDEARYPSRIWASYCYSRNYYYELKTH